MGAALGEPLSGEPTEVLDVIGDHGPLLSAGDLEDELVAAPGQVEPVGDRFHVEVGLPQVAQRFAATSREGLSPT
jgi:hypothetical protein